MSESPTPNPVPASCPSDTPAPLVKEQSKTLGEVLRENAPEILEAIPEKEKPKLAKIVRVERTEISYRSGLLPEPSELASYNVIIPNGADRIMQMAEKQSAHRMELEKTVVTSQQTQEKRGQMFGLVIALVFVLCGTYCALNGHDWYGGSIVGGTLVSIVGIFVYSKRQAKKDLSDKRQQMQHPQIPQAQTLPRQMTNSERRKNRRNR